MSDVSRSRRDGRITAVVFSRNESELLPACLSRLLDFDEVLVCDMESTDATRSVAESYGARVLPVPFALIAESVRQLALDAVESEWTLFVDADELLPSGFRGSLRLHELPAEVAGVRLRYTNVAFGVPLQHVLQGSAKYSLLRSDLARYEDVERAHLPPTFAGPVTNASESVPPIFHENFRSIEQSFEKTFRYARTNPHGAATFAGPLQLPKEIARDVLAGAWRDGRAGVVIVTLNAIARFYAASIDWERQGFPDPGPTPQLRRLLGTAERGRRARLWLSRRLRRSEAESE